MKLSEWLGEKGMTQAEFASQIKSDQGHVSDLVRGKVKPRLETVQLIAKLTKDAVGLGDWLEVKPKKEKEKPEKKEKKKPMRIRVERLRAAIKANREKNA